MAIRVILLFAIVLAMPLLATPLAGRWIHREGPSTPAGKLAADPTGAPTTGAPTTGAPTTGAPTTGASTTGALTAGALTTGGLTTGAHATGVENGGLIATLRPGDTGLQRRVADGEERSRGLPTAVSSEQLGPGPRGGVGSRRFREIQHQLQRLGATYLLLESYGAHELTYRFYCEMAAQGDRQSFESTDQDVLQAMERLLRQVEYWVATIPEDEPAPAAARAPSLGKAVAHRRGTP